MLTQRTPWLVHTSTIAEPPGPWISTKVAASAEYRLVSTISAIKHRAMRRADECEGIWGTAGRAAAWWKGAALADLLGWVRRQWHQCHATQVVHGLVAVGTGGQFMALCGKRSGCVRSTQSGDVCAEEGRDEEAAVQRQW
jgi:hypothetical protein